MIEKEKILYVVHSVEAVHRVPLWPEEHLIFHIYLEECFLSKVLQLFIAHQNAEMHFIRELVSMAQTASPCCAMAARQFCPFYPSFSLLIDESVIFGGKLLRI